MSCDFSWNINGDVLRLDHHVGCVRSCHTLVFSCDEVKRKEFTTKRIIACHTATTPRCIFALPILGKFELLVQEEQIATALESFYKPMPAKPSGMSHCHLGCQYQVEIRKSDRYDSAMDLTLRNFASGHNLVATLQAVHRIMDTTTGATDAVLPKLSSLTLGEDPHKAFNQPALQELERLFGKSWCSFALFVEGFLLLLVRPSGQCVDKLNSQGFTSRLREVSMQIIPHPNQINTPASLDRLEAALHRNLSITSWRLGPADGKTALLTSHMPGEPPMPSMQRLRYLAYMRRMEQLSCVAGKVVRRNQLLGWDNNNIFAKARLPFLLSMLGSNKGDRTPLYSYLRSRAGNFAVPITKHACEKVGRVGDLGNGKRQLVLATGQLENQ